MLIGDVLALLFVLSLIYYVIGLFLCLHLNITIDKKTNELEHNLSDIKIYKCFIIGGLFLPIHREFIIILNHNPSGKIFNWLIK